MKENSTQIIILGGTGDLSSRKLFPALLDLYARKKLPETFNIVGFARSEMSDEAYQQFVREALATHHAGHTHSNEVLQSFCAHLTYVRGSFDDNTSYIDLKATVEQFDAINNVVSNRLYYLAVPPKYYQQIFTDLKESGAADEAGESWTHILVEKPFGHDLATAQALDTQLSGLYREDQIFRIDHYLAKEAVQNILSFRFANTLLKAPWNKDSVESVHINMTETIDVGSREGFYEGVGALRDVGQNHLLQLIALVAMKEPSTFNAQEIRSERTKVLRALTPISPELITSKALRGQYEGYRSSDTVPDDSNTETYFELKTELNLPEWEDVPFYIRSGKALNEASVSVTIHLKDVAAGLFETQSCLSVGNKITLTISPEQTIAITLNAKLPGLGYQLETRELSFTCNKGDSEIKNSYEKVLFDSIIGDQTLFTQTEEVLAAWEYITPILLLWQTLPLHTYPKGSVGPEETIIT